jgi:hypothetical protein
MKTRTLQLKNSVNRSHVRLALLLIAFACFALSPHARAVCQQGCDGTNTNTFLGDNALINNDGIWNTAVGGEALFSNTSGLANTATGWLALTTNTIGSENTANGYQALELNTGNDNTAIGAGALNLNTSGSVNTAVGDQALERNTTGSDNTALGAFALNRNTTGSSNIALGEFAGSKITTGNNNIDIGNRGVLGGEDNKIRIGITGTHMAAFIAGISGETVPAGVGVIVGTDGKLGTIVSSERYKDAVKPMDKASEAILALKPVTFHYKKELDPDGIPQFGLVAEEVEKVNPSLVAHDADGKPYTVRYEAVNAMLLNEFLKEHRKAEEQARINQKQEAAIAGLKSALEKQAAQLQEVSERLEAASLSLRLVENR